jgi:hypothetical protein
MFRAKQAVYDFSKRFLDAGARNRAKLRLVAAREHVLPSVRPLPSFLIIGAMRAGTSSLYKYLDTHPATAAALRKEIRYFTCEYERGEDWYRAHFPVTRRRLAYEATPHYLCDLRAPDRVREAIPDVKLLVMLRDPIARARSEHGLRTNLDKEKRSFGAALEDEIANWNPVQHDLRRDEYLARSMYGQQLGHWMTRFPAESFGVFFAEDLYRDAAGCLASIATFLGIDPNGFGDVSRNYSRWADESKGPREPEVLPVRTNEVVGEDRARLQQHLRTLGVKDVPAWLH